MGIAAIRDGAKTRLETISGLRAHDTVRGSITPPAAAVMPPPETLAGYDVAMGGVHDLRLVIVLVVSKAWDRTAQDLLDSYADPSGANSVYAAFEGDPTLGGIVADSVLGPAGDYGMTLWGEIPYLGCEFPLEVLL